ncbi:MAG: hypothetical protein U0R70_14795 [Solirubrobacteraceae bacterium]
MLRLLTVVAAAAATLALPATADAERRGSSLRFAPNTRFGCEAAPVQDVLGGGVVLQRSGQRTCTWRSLGTFGNAFATDGSLVPANGRITSIAVRSGRNPAPLRVTILNSSPGRLGSCCTARKFGPVFRPRANRITRLRTNIRVERTIDTGTGVVATDVVALTAVGPGTLPVRVLRGAGTFQSGLPWVSFWYPFTRLNDPRVEAYSLGGIELLFQWNFVRGR